MEPAAAEEAAAAAEVPAVALAVPETLEEVPEAATPLQLQAAVLLAMPTDPPCRARKQVKRF